MDDYDALCAVVVLATVWKVFTVSDWRMRRACLYGYCIPWTGYYSGLLHQDFISYVRFTCACLADHSMYML